MQEFYPESGLEDLATLIRASRTRRALTLREFADLTGLHHNTIDHLETKRHKNPTNKTLEKLAPHLGYTLSELITLISQKQRSIPSQAKTAQDVLSYASDLTVVELELLVEHLKNRLASIKLLEDNFNQTT